jgi:hypothetical protein
MRDLRCAPAITQCSILPLVAFERLFEADARQFVCWFQVKNPSRKNCCNPRARRMILSAAINPIFKSGYSVLESDWLEFAPDGPCKELSLAGKGQQCCGERSSGASIHSLDNKSTPRPYHSLSCLVKTLRDLSSPPSTCATVTVSETMTLTE